MDYKKLLFITTSALLMTGCVSTSAPTTHNEFMKEVDQATGFTKATLHKTNTDVNVNYATALSNIRKQVRYCIPDKSVEYGVVGSMMPNTTVTTYKTSVNRVSSRKTQVTFRAHDSNMLMQPDDGFIIFAADITKVGAHKTHIKAASGFTVKNLHEAIIGWSKGSKSCYGIAGKS
ncbi:hypothetical protein PGH07_05815 [Sulfurovum sp. zt1-1]|uniref:Uncharacterized protein n=1 Tax=Sulfurovum zhangzhouensis TaxID=3019067 RepID=A0ABT7QXX3_9BACT|nr:hypothetical protein [Sulfurovum zhangzhouensis]MDM5271684.1 hypothetical protein [Sulfurovum zhangzhouensis]